MMRLFQPINDMVDISVTNHSGDIDAHSTPNDLEMDYEHLRQFVQSDWFLPVFV